MQQTIETILSDLEYAGFDQDKIANAFIDKCRSAKLNAADVALRLLAGYVQLGNGVGKAIQKGKIANPATAVALQSLISATGVVTSVSSSESVTLPRLAQCFPETVMQLRRKCSEIGLTLGIFVDEKECDAIWQDPCLGGLSRCPAKAYKEFLRGFQRAMFRATSHKERAAYLAASEEGKKKMVDEEVLRWEEISLSKGRVQLYDYYGYYGGYMESDLNKVIRYEMALYIAPSFLAEGVLWTGTRLSESPEQKSCFEAAVGWIDDKSATLAEMKVYGEASALSPSPSEAASATKVPEKPATKKSAATGESAAKKVVIEDSVTASSFGKP